MFGSFESTYPATGKDCSEFFKFFSKACCCASILIYYSTASSFRNRSAPLLQLHASSSFAFSSSQRLSRVLSTCAASSFSSTDEPHCAISSSFTFSMILTASTMRLYYSTSFDVTLSAERCRSKDLLPFNENRNAC